MNNNYKSINQSETISFKSCEGCETPCCDGQRFFFIPLILEDFSEVYKKFAIVFAFMNEEWRMVMVLSQNNKACTYFIEGKCSIYNERPPGCHLYPLTPFYDEVLVDTSCPAINEKNEGSFFASNGNVNNSFYHKRLEGFNEKRFKSVAYIHTKKECMKSVGFVNGIEVFEYMGSDDDVYMQMHKKSLKFLEII